MNKLLRKSFSLAAATGIFAISLGSAFGQAVKVTSEVPTLDDLKSPEFTVSKSKPFRPKDWLEIEAKLNLDLRPQPKSKTCDKITVKWYLAVKNPENSQTMLLLTRDIDYVNIPLLEDIYCSVYLSPSSIKRITGLDRSGKNAVEYVGYEVLVNGQKVAAETNKGKPGWWSMPSDRISRSEAVPLLSKMETPFAAIWWDRYAEVSQERR